MEELVTGPGGLLSRGLSKDDATHYGALPRRKQERATLAGILNGHVRVHFSEYAKFHSGAGVVGVPGFWQEPSGVVHIWKPRNYLMPFLVIPYKDANGDSSMPSAFYSVSHGMLIGAKEPKNLIEEVFLDAGIY